jgi:hypothetical protein
MPTSAEIKIKKLRLSFIHVECLAAPLRTWPSPEIPMPFLLSGPLFQAQMNQALNEVEPYSIPWIKGEGRRFWIRYIQKNSPTTKDYWQALVPLGYQPELSPAPVWTDGTVSMRAFLYPWGIASIVDCVMNCAVELKDAVRLAQTIRRTAMFRVDAGTGTRDISLESLNALGMDRVRTAAYGPETEKGQSGDPFSVVTVLDADGGDETQVVEEGGPVHRFLEGLVGWDSKWETLVLDPLKDSTVKIKKSPPGHLLYAGGRGRVVWFPGHFLSKDGASPHTLWCYHQNLMMGSLQVESLGQIAKDAASALDEDQTLDEFPVAYGDCVQFTAGILGRLNGGKNTYRSNSLRRQVQDSFKDEVNAIRKKSRPPMLELSP